MAHGPDPKPAALRRRRAAPSRGEWLPLPPLAREVLPPLPARAKGTGRWSPRTRALWTSLRRDPATAAYGPAEVAYAVDLAYVFELYVRGRWTLAGEVRLRMDGLGLTPKGKRDLRWRSPTEAAAQPERPSAPAAARGRRPRLRVAAVDPT